MDEIDTCITKYDNNNNDDDNNNDKPEASSPKFPITFYQIEAEL